VNDRPTAIELLEAVRRFLGEEVVNALEGHLKYQARVAANVVAIVAREIESEERHLAGEWERLGALLDGSSPAPGDREALRAAIRERNQELVGRIRAGEADSGPWRDRVMTHLVQSVADKLEVAKPKPG
jgi:hypothetical protein